MLLLIGGAYGYFKTKTDDGGFSNKREYTKTGQHMKTDLNTYLNGEWLTTLEEAIGTDKIAEVQWQIGGINWNNYLNKTVPEVYKLELDPTSINTYPNEEYINSSLTKIGLMYVSDYLYAAPKEKWTLCGSDISDSHHDYRLAYTEDWLYSSDYPWTISHYSDYSNFVMCVSDTGNVFNLANDSRAVRPVFYLESSVVYLGGNGTRENPYKLG